MRSMIGWLWVSLFTAVLGMEASAAQSARLRLFCLSVRVEPGNAEVLGLKYRLTFSSAEFATPNHEVYPIFRDDASHGTQFLLEAPDAPEPVPGELALEVPESIDANANGIPDFYEVAMPVGAVSTEGVWAADAMRGTLRAVWRRDAGQRDGVLKLQLTSREFGALPEFTHSFSLLELDGTLSYSGTGETRSALVSVRPVGGLDVVLTGAFQFTRVPTNRLNHFTIDSGSLTNENGLEVPISLAEAERDPDYTMDYFGAWSFLNGDPSTPEVDYELFYFGIDDPNDSDGDGIPDFTDDQEAPPAAPRLEWRRTAGGLELTLVGEVGTTFVLERASVLAAEEWIDDRRITLKSPREVVQLEGLPGEARYFRLRWP